ncbi:hypothetical protein Spiaf_2358 [Spirochaeta africana DSM 8902]|uniref:Uncharacterized protein n=2 Tax=Spirochaeta TaxID=146 RepID=H9ULJ7_SPIAZ|nr:hypothetical protein Spiaf_2358 [Spirochaeta africana DSM 8902]
MWFLFSRSVPYREIAYTVSSDYRAEASGPIQTLLRVADLSENDFYDEIRNEYIYDVQFHSGNSSADRIIEGMQRKHNTGNFAYHPDSFRFIGEHLSFAIRPAHGFVLERLIGDSDYLGQDARLARWARNEPERFWLFSYFGADILFVNHQETWKIVFTRNAANFQ